jgi:hypothetical protein
MEHLRSDPSLIPSAVEELLRYESPSQHTARLAPADVELGGKQVRKRQAVIAVMGAGNRDPERFADPDRLDLGRADNRHLAFGWAAHFCFGAALARMEGQIAFETLLRRLPNLELAPDASLVWRHNLGLRGLTALPVCFGKPTSARKKDSSIASREEKMASRDVKQALLEKCLRGELGLERAQKISRRRPDEPVPLSYSQEQIWMHAQLAPDVPLYNEPVTIHYTGALDPAALEQAFNEILCRHEAWRTCFRIVDGEPVQVVMPELSISLPVIDLRTLPPQQREMAAVIIATEEVRKPLDLARAPVFRASLIQLGDQKYRLYLTLSHLIFDGVAIYRVFLAELASLYAARVVGQQSLLPRLEIQYADYSCWQRKTTRNLTQHIAYWRRQLRGLPVLELLPDRPQPAVQTFRGSLYAFQLSPGTTEAVRRASRREGATVFQMLLATFAALLGRYSGQEDFAIGTVTAGRDHPQTTALLGYFLNIVVLRTDLSGDPSFRELLRRVQSVTLEALDHDAVPFSMLLRELNVRRDPSRNPLFQVMFSLEPPMPEVDPAWELTHMDIDTGAVKSDLYLQLDERQDDILASLRYSTDLFDSATIVRMAEHWMRLVAGAAHDPELRVSDLPMLSEAETGWNGCMRRRSIGASTSQEALLIQLENLSTEEARNLLRTLLNGRQNYELRS